MPRGTTFFHTTGEKSGLGGPAIHPGEILSDELTEIWGDGIRPGPGHWRTDQPRDANSEGQRGITADTALRLGQWFGSGPEIWMDLQKDYELRTAETELGDALKAIPHLPERPPDPRTGSF